MDLTTLIILLISLTALVIAGIVVIYKRQRDPEYIKTVKAQKNKPLMRNSDTMKDYLGRRVAAIPFAIAFVLILVLLAKCGIT
jgi:hypothetical protein